MSLHTLAHKMFTLTKRMEGICQNVGLTKALACVRVWHIGSPYFDPILAHFQTSHIAYLL